MRDRIIDFEYAEHGDVLLASLDGEIDASNASELRLAISERLPPSATALVLDLSRVSYLDSSGIHLLFELGRRLGARRQGLRLIVPDGAPTRRVLELCNIGAIAPISPTAAAAIGEATGSGPAGSTGSGGPD